jgi:hypothetical protein
MVSATRSGFLALGRLDHGDHAIQERLAGVDVMRTTSQSDSTRVPPVTDESRRRPRGSRAPIRR